MTTRMLTEREAFRAAREFLVQFNERDKSLNIHLLVGWMEEGRWEHDPLETSDPAQWHDWVASVDKVARILLDVAPVPTPGGEAAAAMDCLERTAPLVPGTQGIVYDTALRGTHHQRILRNLGILPVNRVTAAPVRGGRHPKRARPAKTVFVEQRTINVDGSERTIDLYARNGTIGLGTLNTVGELHFTSLPRVRTHRHADKIRYRWYNDLRLPDHLGGGILTVRLHGNAEDVTRRFNRTENVRPIPPDDPTFPTLFRRRNDAESINRALEDTMWLRRAHSIGHKRQHLNLLGYALMINSLALARHTRPAQTAA